MKKKNNEEGKIKKKRNKKTILNKKNINQNNRDQI
jgi:hypothetical protein